MGSDVVSEVMEDAIISIDCGQASPHETPLFLSEPGDIHSVVVVLEEGDDQQPTCVHKERGKVVEEDGFQPIDGAEVGEKDSHQGESHQREGASEHVTSKEGVGDAHVRDVPSRVTVAEDVVGEGAEAQTEAGDADNLEFPGFPLLADGIENFVFLDVGSVFVVVAMTQLPLVIGNHD